MVETSVLPSPVFISAIQPKCSAIPPISWTSKGRWPSTRHAPSRTTAKASIRRSSRRLALVEPLLELDGLVPEHLVVEGLHLVFERR